MLFSNLRLSVPCMPINRVPSTFLLTSFGYVVECTQFLPNTTQSNHPVSLVKNIALSLSFVNSFPRPLTCRALHTTVDTREASHVAECREQKLSADLFEEQTSNEEIRLGSYCNSTESFGCKDHKENQRRRKIGLANKGKVPWNKGRKHSAETCERIRQRTKEALRDPKVRKKMSECPRAHSNQTKARISLSLRRLWGERLKWKRSREQFLLSWAESIAKAAKKGGSGQQELDWDSYDKMNRERTLQQLLWAVEKSKAKEMACIRVERAAKAKGEKMVRLAQKRKEQEEKAKVGGEIKRETRKKSKEEKEVLAVAQELKLKARLTKIHRKKSLNGHVSSRDPRDWERFDLEFIKRERMQKEVSLADQIRAVKNKRSEFVGREALTTSSSIYPSSDLSH